VCDIDDVNLKVTVPVCKVSNSAEKERLVINAVAVNTSPDVNVIVNSPAAAVAYVENVIASSVWNVRVHPPAS
jgi:hypothetical protein